jgi:four helix bundle protein
MGATARTPTIAYRGKRYERLTAWAACHELVLSIYRLTEQWPDRERFGMIAQARGAAFSAAANIAEGAAKRGPREFRRFLDISIGSLAELSYALRVAKELEFPGREELGAAEALCDHAGRLTWGLYRVVAGRSANR